MGKTVAVVPAKGTSTRLPEKNTLLLGDVPLFVHSIIYAQNNSSIIDDVYVSTDDTVIKTTALEHGAQIIDRPKKLCSDTSTTVSALAHALKVIDDDVENVVLLQPTNPLRPSSLLKDSFKEFNQGGYDSLVTVSPNLQKFGHITNGKFVPFNYSFGQRSQDMKALYYENGLLYITKSSLILQQRIQGDRCCPFIVDHPFSTVDIDTEDDFHYAQFIMNQYSENSDEPHH